MAINLNDMMNQSASAAGRAQNLRYGTVGQPPALNFVQPQLDAIAAAEPATKAAVEPVTQMSMAGMLRKANTEIEGLMLKAFGPKKQELPATGVIPNEYRT